MAIQAIVTIPPYADFIEDVVSHPLVSGLRLNTVMPIKEPALDILRKLSGYGKPIWVDLKSRQLRTVGASIPPFTTVEISHPIQVKIPTEVYFSDGQQHARIMAVNGNHIILDDGPHRLIGPGESINIIDPTLNIEGLLTPTDLTYLDAMRKLGLTNIMLSYVESPADIEEVKQYIPRAEIIAKIESKKGLKFAADYQNRYGNLMAARGDLYIEVGRPHNIVDALQTIIHVDPQAIVASRIFDSLVESPIPSSADISDVAFLLKLGYKKFMFGDEICLHKETILEGLNLLKAITGHML